MTIANAFKLFFKELNGVEPTGRNIADIIRDGVASMGGDEDANPDTEAEPKGTE